MIAWTGVQRTHGEEETPHIAASWLRRFVLARKGALARKAYSVKAGQSIFPLPNPGRCRRLLACMHSAFTEG